MIETQRAREVQQVVKGAERYHHRQREEGTSNPGKELVRRAVEPLADALVDLIQRTEAGKAGSGRPAVATQYLLQLEPGAVAYITARACITAAARSDKLPTTATYIASLIEEHYRFEELQADQPALAITMSRKAAKWSTDYHRRAIMRHAADVASIKGLEWTLRDKLLVGTKLIDMFIETCGLVEAYRAVEGKNNTPYRLRPTPKTADWLAKMHARCELLEPIRAPMIVPPKPWTSAIDGGYLTAENRADFVRGVSPALRDDLLSLDLSTVFDAVNTIQATAWSINRPVLAVMQECWNSGSTLAGIPPADSEPVPERPADIPSTLPVDSMSPEVRERFDAWRRQAAAAHDRNAELIGRRMAFLSRITMAAELKDQPAIYFPHNVDFRGRVYSLATDLNPQSDDFGKALLQFAEGKPLGEHGAYWLAVHIANLFGIDKVSFDDRVEWVLDHTAELLDSAANPLDGARFWTQADDPWCALAACFEWAGYHAMRDDYVSHLPIAMDGSCSGLQHFSAMLKDEQGGRAVNLTPTDAPADIYTEVAAAVERHLLKSTEQLAISWRGKVTRKIVKRPCMTFAYSVTSRGIRDQILDECRKAAQEYLPGWSNFEAATFLAPIVEQAIRETVDRAAEAMDWLRDTVRVLLANGQPVVWLTPLGFPVHQRYMRSNPVRLKVWFGGQQVRLQTRSDTTKPDIRRQCSAIAPNFVHSLDATHLMMTVQRMRPVTSSMAVIHDSFGVHACDVDELHYALRDEFIALYSDDQLARFMEQAKASLPADKWADLPELPAAGGLDLDAVRRADFFFA